MHMQVDKGGGEAFWVPSDAGPSLSSSGRRVAGAVLG